MMHVGSDFKLHLAFQHGHQLVRTMREILPPLDRRVSSQLAIESTSGAQSSAKRFG
jgi:hypothetical protein